MPIPSGPADGIYWLIGFLIVIAVGLIVLALIERRERETCEDLAASFRDAPMPDWMTADFWRDSGRRHQAPVCRALVDGLPCKRRMGHDGEHTPVAGRQRLYLIPSPGTASCSKVFYDWDVDGL